MNRLLYAHSLRLLVDQIRGLGAASQLAILRSLPSLSALAEASDKQLLLVRGPRKELLRAARDRLQRDGVSAYEDRAGAVIEKHDQAEIRMAAIGDISYPALLARCADAPPVFMLVAHDDKSNPIEAAMLYLEYKKRDLSAELHICAKGGHGFGMRKDGKPINDWPQRCAEWMKSLGYLGAN